MKSVIYLILGIISFIIFAYDIEYDRDFMTWLWLLQFILLLTQSIYLALKTEINKIKNEGITKD